MKNIEMYIKSDSNTYELLYPENGCLKITGSVTIKDIQASTTDLTAGTSALATGSIYLVYE